MDRYQIFAILWAIRYLKHIYIIGDYWVLSEEGLLIISQYRDSLVNSAMDNGSNCLLVQNVAGTERIDLSHSKFAWLMVQEILDNGSILFLFSTSKVYILSH